MAENQQTFFGMKKEELEDRIAEAIESAQLPQDQALKPTRDQIPTFGWITRDNNPLHTIPDVAKRMGFRDTPLMGAHIAAYAEQYAQKFIERARKKGLPKEITLIGEKAKFEQPVYPGDALIWEIKSYQLTNGRDRYDQPLDVLRINFEGSVAEESGQKKAIDCSARFALRYDLLPQIAGAEFWRRYTIEQEHLDAFYQCVGEKANCHVPHMFTGAFVPATLLELLEDRTQKREGINASFDFDFLREVHPGMLKVEVYPIKGRPRQITSKESSKSTYMHKIPVSASQESRPVLYGEITCLAPVEIEV